MRDGKKVTTTSICFDSDVYVAMIAETSKLGYGSKSRLVNHAMRKLLGLKLRPRKTEGATR
jgi:hypothetical protein